MIRPLLLLSLSAQLAAAQPPAPPGLQGVGIEQRLGQQVPLDATFRDEAGRTVALRDCFHGRPVVLTLVYYGCPNLCTFTLDQLGRTLNVLSESAGKEFDVITVSFDPRETPQLAAEKKHNYLRGYRRPTAEAGWRFLTGDEDAIRRLTQAVGFSYRWDPEHRVYAHASALIVLTPDGKVSRYFLGVDYPPTQLRQALAQARTGTVGTPVPEIFLYCFHYDPATGRYGLIISRALSVMGVLTVLGIAGLIATLSLVRRRRPGEVSP